MKEREVCGVQPFRYRWSVVVVTISVLASIATAFLLPRKPSATERAIEAKLAELRGRGVPLSPAEVAKVLPDPDPDHDARNVLAKALELASQETDSADLPLLGDGQMPKRGEVIPEPVMNAMRLHLADGAVMKAVPERLDGVRFSLKWNSGCTNPPVYPKLFEIRALIQTLMLQAIYEAESGSSSGACEALQKGFQVAWTVNDDDLLMTMIRVACAKGMCDVTEQVLNRVQLTEREIMKLEDQIAPERVGDFKKTFVTERAVRLMWFDKDWNEYRNRSIKARIKDIAQRFGRRVHPKYREEDRLLFLDSIEAREHTLTLPVASCLHSNLSIQTEYWNKVKSVAGEENSLNGGKSWKVAFETRTGLIVLKSVLAIERYRLSNSGAMPGSLDDLVPGYLPVVPIDLFDGRPLRYEKRDAGYVIYSIGADGKDDGGKEPAEPPEPEGSDVTAIIAR